MVTAYKTGYLPYLYQDRYKNGYGIFMLSNAHIASDVSENERYMEYQCLDNDMLLTRRIYQNSGDATDTKRYVGSLIVDYTLDGAKLAYEIIKCNQSPVLKLYSMHDHDYIYLDYMGYETMSGGGYKYLFSKTVTEKNSRSNPNGSWWITRNYNQQFNVTGSGDVEDWCDIDGKSRLNPDHHKYQVVSANINLNTDLQYWKFDDVHYAITHGANLQVTYKESVANATPYTMTLNTTSGSSASNLTYLFTGIQMYNGNLVYTSVKCSATAPSPTIGNGWTDFQHTIITVGGSGSGINIPATGSPERPVYFSDTNAASACAYGISADSNGQSVGVIYFR
jgi:hypothetical protein